MSDIAYQNKDITSKVTAESLLGNSLAPFGLPDLKVIGLLPTNLPAIESNELRLDHLFLLEDGSTAIIDYESKFTKENFVKYLNYAARVIKRYADQNQLEDLKSIKVLVIYTADVEWAKEVYDFGDLVLRVEASYLVKQDSDGIYEALNHKIHAGDRLTEEELARLMILPLTVKGKAEKQVYIEKAVELAKRISDRSQSVRVLAGILTFTDKVIDPEYAKKVKEEWQMTQIGKLIFDNGYKAGEEQGIELGIERGVKALILDGLEENIPEDKILSKLMKLFDLTDVQAHEYMKKYRQ